MAYTATITKGTVTKSDGFYNIPLSVVINDGTEDVVSFSVSERYNTTTTPTEVTDRLKQSIKEKWDKYIDEQGIENSAALDTAIGSITTDLNTYINQ